MLLQTAITLCWLGAPCLPAVPTTIEGSQEPAAATIGTPEPAAPHAAMPVPSLPPSPAADDRWFAEDKVRHLALAFAGTGMSFGAARAAGLDREAGLVAAGSTMLLAGIGKEIRDRRRGGPFSGRDLAWDLAGIAAGLALAAGTR